MKMTNLYNFETSLPLALGIVNRLPNGPRMLVQPEEQKEGEFRIDTVYMMLPSKTSHIEI